MIIKAQDVKELREKTGLGMMECKKALEEANGNLEEAIKNLRKSSALKAEKKASRTAVEGIITSKISDKEITFVEVNCETDFVAKDENFIKFCEEALKVAVDASSEVNLLDEVSESMEKLQSYPDPELKEKCTERALSSIYFLQKCLDFEKGGELAVKLFKVYEYCRKQIIQFCTVDSKVTLKQAILFINTIYEGWEGMKQTN